MTRFPRSSVSRPQTRQSVRTPDSCNAPSCFNCSRPSSVKPVGGAGAVACVEVEVAAGRLAVSRLLRVLLWLLRRLPGLSSSSDEHRLLLAGRSVALIRLANAASATLRVRQDERSRVAPTKLKHFHNYFFLLTLCFAASGLLPTPAARLLGCR